MKNFANGNQCRTILWKWNLKNLLKIHKIRNVYRVFDLSIDLNIKLPLCRQIVLRYRNPSTISSIFQMKTVADDQRRSDSEPKPNAMIAKGGPDSFRWITTSTQDPNPIKHVTIYKTMYQGQYLY